MVIDNKIDGLPVVTKILSIVPMLIGIGLGMVPELFLQVVGGIVFLFALAAVSAQERVKIDFANRKYRSYYKVLGMNFGKWRPLKNFSQVTLTLNKSQYREVNYALYRLPTLKIPMFSFLETNVNINLKFDKNRLEIARGKYTKMRQLALEVGKYNKTDVYDCTQKEKELTRFKE